MKWFFAVFLSLSFVFLAIFGINCIYGTLFPVKFENEVAIASEESGIEKAVLFSVINIESHFNSKAVSSKGAVGLMQILPSTAKELANEETDLFDVETNISLGAKYLKKLQIRFENLETALCAYNAGPTNVANWLSNEEFSEDGKTLKKIPFVETRGYVEKFRKNLKYYQSKVK